MADRRPKGLLEIGWACLDSAARGRVEHRPTAADYPDSLVRRVRFYAGGGLGWKLSALATPRPRPAPWKIVVITGAPSWAEYWSPVLAALPPDRQMLVADRPGFAASEPWTSVTDLAVQATALSPLLQTAPGQKLLLVGQSYGAAIASLLAAGRPRRLGGLLLLSSYLGEPGPMARWLIGVGSKTLGVMPRDLRNAVLEVSEPRDQFGLVQSLLPRLRIPVHIAHGDADDFAPIETARRLAQTAPARTPVTFHELAGAGHFINDGPTKDVLTLLERCLPLAGRADERRRRPALPWRATIPSAAPA